MLRLNCFIRVSVEHRETVLAAARRLTAASLQQEGCVAYDIFESATRPEVLMICETWKNRADLEAHTATEHFRRIVPRLQALATMTIEEFTF